MANLEQDDTCHLCLEGIESPEHLFDECHTLAGVKLELFGKNTQVLAGNCGAFSVDHKYHNYRNIMRLFLLCELIEF